jgi:hypothetical protein
MTIDELRNKLDSFIKELPASGYDTVSDNTIAGFESCAGPAGELGMKQGKQLIENLVSALKARKTGANTDESVQVRFTALDFYLKKLESSDTEDL